tara:strand:+ start:591 stop:1001 length:411 start_codon:yes stop_codon:yes gene_type:complete
MNITKALDDLDNSWSKDIILEKIKKGETTDKIVKDFIKSNEITIKLVSNYVETNNSNLLENIEKLSICEIKLINEIKSLQKENIDKIKTERSSTEIETKLKDFNFASFLQKWSNNFVIYLLILISLISLTKQAWAL